MGEAARLDAWFVHPRLALGLLEQTVADDLLTRLPPHSHPMWRSYHMSAMERMLGEALEGLPITALAVGHVEETLQAGDLVWMDQHLYYQGVGAALKKARAGEHGRVKFHAPMSTDRSVEIVGTLNVEHLTSSTSTEELSGSGRHFIVGYVKTLDPTRIEIRPILIADRWGRGIVKPGIGFIETEPHHVFASQVDQFDGVDWALPLQRPDLNVLKGASEKTVKTWFAEIFNEPEIPVDWGGEQFDLWTAGITIDGKPARAAFAFKGPAKFHPMTIADLGKNGDQISRLAHTVADILVVQHTHAITAPVEHMLHAFAVNPANPRRYMTIDGYQTIRILKHFGYLK